MTDRELNKNPNWSDLYVDDKKRYVYCKVEKVACTSWKRVLMTITGKMGSNKSPEKLNFNFVHVRADEYIRELSSYKPKEIEFRLKNYYKFMFVREPLERLVSAYRDKMKRGRQYSRLRSHIRRRFNGYVSISFTLHKVRTDVLTTLPITGVASLSVSILFIFWCVKKNEH
jgi:hypothetical protein